VRAGPRVRRERFADAGPALTALQERLLAHAAQGGGRDPVSVLGRDYEPVRQVAARGEVRWPGLMGRRAGADLRGDGSVETWMGWVRRTVVVPREDETPWDALRREVAGR
jgi:hypothetical protein